MVFQHFGSVQPAHHVYLSWQLGGIRDCRVDCILGRPKFSFFISMRSIAPTSSQSVGISLIPQSPLQASPMNVGNALAVPLFTDFQNASECIRSHGPDSCCIMGVKGKVADRANLPFHVLEFVAIGSWNLGARTQQSIVTAWGSFQYHMDPSTPKCLHYQTR